MVLRYKMCILVNCAPVLQSSGAAGNLQGGCSGQLLQHGYLLPFEMAHGAPCYTCSRVGISGSCATSALRMSHMPSNHPTDGTSPSGS